MRYLVPLVLAALMGCTNKDAAVDTGHSGSSLSVHPPMGGQGTSMEIDLDATRSVFDFSDTTVDFGPGISVDTVEIDDGWSARAAITIEADAALGTRDVTVETGGRSFAVADGFEVISQSFDVEPNSAKMGESVDVVIIGHNTDWQGGVTWPHFGDGVNVIGFTVVTPTLAEASLSISPVATPGWRDVVMEDAASYVTLYDGFMVDRVGLAATFEPDVIAQGEKVEFTVRGRGTDFLSALPSLTFFDVYGENPDIVVDTLVVLDAENMYGEITASNAAALGERDVLIAADDEGVLIEDAIEVVGGTWDLERVAVSLTFYVSRAIDNTTGAISEGVVAYAVFYNPLDPPCPPAPEGTQEADDCTDEEDNDGDGFVDCDDYDCRVYSMVCPSPQPYDINVPSRSPDNGEEDCPFPQTVPAGDYVWLESDVNTVTLERTDDPSTGTVYYYGQDLTLEDYVFDNWYDLHLQGEEGGLPEILVEAVLPTVPADWELLTPELWGNYTHNRAEDFVFTWTPAQTYPSAYFTATMSSTLADADGWMGSISSIPWDDGEWWFTSDELAVFEGGPAYFNAASSTKGPEFGLPDSVYQSNQASTSVSLQAYLVLE